VEDPSDFHTSMVAALRRHVPVGSRVLEIGVGSGYLLSELSARAECRCVGIDVIDSAARASLETARRAGGSFAFVQGTGFRLPFHDATFDVVTSLGVIEHYAKTESIHLLHEHARVCRAGGRVIVSVPNRLDFTHSLLRAWQGRAYAYYPERSYTPWELSRELRRVGLEPQAADGYAPLWALRQHRLGYPVIAVLSKMGLLDRLHRIQNPRILSWLGNLTLWVATKPVRSDGEPS
jgi:SAM-dependent methyltransferase